MQEPDPELIRAAAGGDLVAFEQLVRAYQTPVLRFLRHLVGDQALAEDLTQETFLRVYRRLRSFRYRSKFSTWIFQVARNVGIDALRARERRARLLRSVTPRGPTADGSLHAELTASLDALSPKLREAFVVIEVLGLTYREAGQTLGIPEGTVKSRVYHAREQLCRWLSATDERRGGERRGRGRGVERRGRDRGQEAVGDL